ncbi:type IV secretory system conjugative DNA transfer family protein [Photobacterium damselae subsp. damselae]|uniref:type IV secretory system conjugative DNA transfer family protein n=2 Tax=Photobacterium damselae TaxID=38293 RepID=UPI000D8D1047|nr:hypothetical protein EQ875_02593 [Photobacterium damselae subsp. damselae]SPY31599.1 Type IV secretory pathway, VirB4 components [Photobacterium damselae]
MMAKKPQLRFPNPRNPNNALSNKHCFYVATSEGGKTSAVKKMPKDPRLKANEQYVFFDPYGDYQGVFKGKAVQHYSNASEFYLALCKARNSKKAFRIAYQPMFTTAYEMDRFCGIVWSLGDGSQPMHVIIEEVAQFVNSSGSATGYLNNLISVGRKFGLMLSFLFQRGQAVPKTLIGNCAYKWIGMQERQKDAYYLSEETGIPVEEILSLTKLHYVFKSPGSRDNYEKGVIRYKKM